MSSERDIFQDLSKRAKEAVQMFPDDRFSAVEHLRKSYGYDVLPFAVAMGMVNIWQKRVIESLRQDYIAALVQFGPGVSFEQFLRTAAKKKKQKHLP